MRIDHGSEAGRHLHFGFNSAQVRHDCCQRWGMSIPVISGVGVLLVACSCAACNSQRFDPDMMFVPAGAIVEYKPQIYQDGSSDLIFVVADTARDDLTRDLVRHFDERGWRQRRTSRSGVPTSFTTGWETAPGGGVYVWRAEWDNAWGDIIKYDLRYAVDRDSERPNEKRTGIKVRGYATYTPRR
jgi:hypothetical protein